MSDIGRLLTAMCTPFTDGGDVDYDAAQRLARLLVADGSDGVVVAGTTGESPTLTDDEKIDLLRATKEAIPGHSVVTGTGGNDTRHSLELSERAMRAGTDALLAVVPYYNKPTQEGMYQHFKAVADAVDIPIILYNVPPRTSCDLQVDTVIRLSQVRNIVGIKDASYDMARPTLTKLKATKGFLQLSGEDASAMGFMAQGGDGCISVTANIAPRLCGDMHDAWKAHDLDKVFEIQDRLMPLHKAMFVETSPAPVKYGAELLGLCSAKLRLPLVETTDATRKQVRDAMVNAGLIN
jgi:4-hydroxy-tetrahydrodipicolinate synthase